MEWFKDYFINNTLDIKRKTFFKSINYENKNNIIILIKTYIVLLSGVEYSIEMKYVYGTFGELYNKSFSIDKENKILEETFYVIFKFNEFFLPVFHVPFLKFIFTALLILGIISFVR